MRHPFEGILGSEANRRDVLKAAAVGGAVLAVPAIGSAEDKKEAGSGKYGRYLVIPTDMRGFYQKKKDLGILGGYFSLPSEKGLRRTGGFLAWLTPDQAKKLEGNEAVKKVMPIGAKHIPGPGKVFGKNKPTGLRVSLMPNGWRGADAKTYTGTDALIKEWNAKLGKITPVKISRQSAKLDRYLKIEIKDMTKAEKVAAALKQQAQVERVYWDIRITATTLALGEEGGGPTTKALGEEGASTRALGEEGGKPRPTTLALGEEGGKPLTKAKGENGVIRPLPPKVSTRALGEEGGKASTEAVGEEGGKKRPILTRALNENGKRLTTLAAGEEGGKKPRPATQALQEGGKGIFTKAAGLGEGGKRPAKRK